MSVRVLHISDLHIGKSVMPIEDLVYSINLAMQNNPVDLIIFTGDLIDGECVDENNNSLNESKRFFDELLRIINQNTKNYLTKNDILFVPGNHEIDRKNKDNPFHRYKDFLKLFYGDIPDFYNLEDLSVFKVIDDSKIVFLGFNSAHYDLGKERDKDYGRISNKQISIASSKLNSISNISEYNVVPFLHHHFYLVEEREKQVDDNNYLKNSETLLSSLRPYNVSLILHGHKHRNLDKRIIISKLSEPDKIATVIGCGSLAKKDTAYNAFNYIEIFSQKDRLQLIYSEYVYESSTFNKETTIKLPFHELKRNEGSLLDYLEEDAALYNDYTGLKSIDTLTQADDMIDIFNKTVGCLNNATKNLYEDKNCIINLFVAMHYRSNKSSEKNFIPKIKEFIKRHLVYSCGIEKIISILDLENIYALYNSVKTIIKDLPDAERKRFIFLIIGFFLSEMYLTLKKNGEKFFNLNIKSKCDFGIEKDSLNENILGNDIKILADEDRRALAIEIVCTNAQAHKMITLIIKEFEIILTPFEEYFANVGFKIYYILPTLNKFLNENKTELESYTFGTYLPTLIPLLAGERLYSQAETFTRELIQNSVDAISLRKKMSEGFNEDGKIDIVIDQKNGIKSFEISDNGTGMNKYILERYFTTIGRSFYKSDDYRELKAAINPISNFGIGFLSCFLVGKKIEVRTKYIVDENNEEQAYWLDIPNYDGCFFIEKTNKENYGTKITIYEDVGNKKKVFDAKKIIKYMEENILNIDYDLSITDNIYNYKKTIKQNQYIENLINKTRRNKLLFYIPFDLQTNISANDIIIAKFYENEDFRKSNNYGIFIYKEDDRLYEKQKIVMANAGISVNRIEKTIKALDDLTGNYFDIFINSPSDLIDLDVSRNEIVETSPLIRILKELSDMPYLQNQYKNYKKIFTSESENIPYTLLSYMDRKECLDNIRVIIENHSFKIRLLTDNMSTTNSEALNDFFTSLKLKKLDAFNKFPEILDGFLHGFSRYERRMSNYLYELKHIACSDRIEKGFKMGQNYYSHIFNDFGFLMSTNWQINDSKNFEYSHLSSKDYIALLFLSLLYKYEFNNKARMVSKERFDFASKGIIPFIGMHFTLNQLKKGITINLEEVLQRIGMDLNKDSING